MDRRYVLLFFTLGPLAYFTVYAVAFGEEGLRAAASNFLAIAPVYMVIWFATAVFIYLTWTTPRPRVITVRRYRIR